MSNVTGFTADRKFVLMLLVLNLVVCLAFFLLSTLLRREKGKKWFQFAIMLLCPVIGPLYMLISSVVYRCFYKNAIDRAIVSFNKDRAASYRMPEEEEELNLVPMGEALAVSHKSDQRKLLMQVLKGGSSGSLESVRMALESEDSETSHYAASAILDVTSQFEADAERMLKQLRDAPEDLGRTLRTADLLYGFLRQGVLSELEMRSYVYETESVYENLYRYHRDDMGADRYYQITELLLKIGDMPQADGWSQRAIDERDDELDAYRARLQYLYRAGERQGFQEVLTGLKRSDIRIDEQTLEMIRFLS